MSRNIVLLTDFGVKDTYVGVMKGVMSRIFSDANFIDLTHSITPQNVREAALALLSAYRFFSQHTLFLVVVDPGVGSTRRPIAVAVDTYMFVAPDNGVLSYVLAEYAQYQAVELCETEFHLQPTSHTFHGRDIFAPAAAHLANGVPLEQLGPSINSLKHLPVPRLEITPSTIKGEVVHIDHFGNIITSIGQFVWVDSEHVTLQPRFVSADIRHFNADQLTVMLNGDQIYGLKLSYSAVEPGDALVIVGSSGFLELAVNQGSGAERWQASIGDKIEVHVR